MKIAKRVLMLAAVALIVAAGVITANTQAKVVAGDGSTAGTKAKQGLRFMWGCHIEAHGPFREGPNSIRGTGIIACEQFKMLTVTACVQWFDPAYNEYVNVRCRTEPRQYASAVYAHTYTEYCVTGRYRVVAWGDAVWPDGSNPEYPPGATTSPVQINC